MNNGHTEINFPGSSYTGSKKAEGVIPDIYIRDHLLDENDEILDGLLKIIENKP